MLGSAYGRTARGRTVARFVNEEPPFPQPEEEAVWKVGTPHEEYAPAMWRRILWEASIEFLEALMPSWRSPGFEHIAPRTALARWLLKYGRHPDLTVEGRLEVVTVIPQAYELLLKEKARDRGRVKRMELATIAAQQELILARLEGLRQTQMELLDKVSETVERVRERFPNDADVSAAVDRLLEDLS